MTQPASAKATLFVVSAPSGAGKTSLVKALIDSMDALLVSISHTTRSKRPSEVDGSDYHFISESDFLAMIGNHDFLEHARVFDHHYGTSKNWVIDRLNEGTDVILEIDWQGASQIAKQMDCVSIFILPPSIEALKQRLNTRSQDSNSIIEQRMSKAQNEISHFHEADFVIINDDFETALAEMQSIVRAERCKTLLQKEKLKDLIQNLLTDTGKKA